MNQLAAVADIETFSKKENAVITNVGCVIVNPITGEEVGTFYRRVAHQCLHNRERDTCEDTLRFWGRQKKDSPEAYDEVFTREKERLTLKDTLREFSDFLMKHFGDASRVVVYGNGPEFDCSILNNAYTHVGMPIPWFFWNQESLRTVNRLYVYKHGEKLTHKIPFEGRKHHALDDARFEAKVLIAGTQDYIGKPDGTARSA